MRLPSWLRTKRRRRVGRTVEVTLELDLTAYQRGLVRAMESATARSGFTMAHTMGAFASMARGASEASAALLKMQAAMNADMVEGMQTMVRRELARQEVRQAGLEARYYVRGAMDPRFTTPEARDAYVRDLLLGGAEWGAFRAAAFLRGWVEHHDPDAWPELSGVCMCGATIRPDRFCGESYHMPMDVSAYLWSLSR